MADIRIIPALGAINVTGSADFRGTGASSVLFVSGSGNVGVGTADPGSKLHIQGAVKATATTGHVFGTSTDTSRALSILNSNLADASSHAITLGYGASNNNQAELSFYLVGTGSASNRLSLGLYNSSDTLNILGNGSVGIGTVSPSSGYKLDVVGSVLARAASGNVSFVVATNNANGAVNAIAGSGLEIATDGTNQNIAFRTGVSTRMYIKSDGNVGIGTGTPRSSLHVAGAGNSAGGNIIIGNHSDGVGKWSFITSTHYSSSQEPEGFSLIGGYTTETKNAVVIGGNIYESNPSTEIQFWTHTATTHSLGGTQKMNINSAGQIKFNTYGSNTFTGTPAYGLAVDSSGNVIETTLATINGSGTANYVPKWSDSDTLTNSIMYDDGTNIGVGESSPSYKLHVGGSFRASGLGTFGGSVGIGITNPAYKLDVLIPDSGDTSKQNVQQWGHTNQNTLQLNMYGGATDLVQFAAVNAEQNISIVTEASANLSASTTKGIYIKSGGSVGIGTTNPTTKLNIPNGEISTEVFSFSDINGITPYNSVYIAAPRSANLGLFTASTERITISSSGNVGIGATNPVKTLVVNKSNSGAAGGYIRLENTIGGAGANVGIDFATFSPEYYSASLSSTDPVAQIQATDISNYAGRLDIKLRTAGTSGTLATLATFHNNGNVGIGSTVPGYKLDVNGNARFGSDVTVDGILTAKEFHTTFVSASIIYESGSTQFGDTDDDTHNFIGRVTISGSTSASPAGQLNVYAGAGAWSEGIVVNPNASSTGAIFFRATKDTATGTWFVGHNSTEGFSILKNGLTGGTGYRADAAQQIKNTGEAIFGFKVGIGTTNPTRELHVKGVSGWAEIALEGGTAGSGGSVEFYSGSTQLADIYGGPNKDLTFRTNGTATAMFINSSGNVGIGTTSPTTTLSVLGGGGTAVGTTDVVASFKRVTANQNAYLAIDTTSTGRDSGIRFGEAGVNTWTLLSYKSSATDGFGFYNHTGSAFQLFLGDDGNTGINTPTPAAKLDVNGLSIFRGQGVAASGTLTLISADSFIRFNTTGGTTDKQKWDLRAISANGYEGFEIRTINDANDTFSSKLTIGHSGNIRFHNYGSGTKTGTQAYNLAVDSSGNIIETGISIDGSGTANYIPKWSDSDTLTDSILYQSGSNIGINATNPNSVLTVRRDVTDNDLSQLGKVQLELAGSTDSNKQLLAGFETENNYGFIQTLAYGSSWTAYNLALQWKGGNVGIGTTQPDYKLKVAGTFYALGTTIASTLYVSDVISANNGVNINGAKALNLYNAANNSAFTLYNSGSSGASILVMDGGSVGIGITNPTAKLDVYQSGSTTFNVAGSQGQLFSVTDQLSGSLMSVNDISGIPILEVFSDDRVVAGQFGQNTLVVNGTKVGIGTATPSYKLDVATGNDDAIKVYNSLGGNNNGIALAVGSGTPWIDFHGSSFDIKYNTSPGTWNSGANRFVTILSGGNVGIGTTNPTNKLVVAGGTSLRGGVNVTQAGYIDSGSTVDIIVDSQQPRIYSSYWSGTEKSLRLGTYSQQDLLTLTTGGSVGVGVTNPISKLQVNGQFRQIYAQTFIANPLDTDGYAGHVIVNSDGTSTGTNGNLSGLGMYTNSSYHAAAGLFALQESEYAASMVFYAGSNLATERMRLTSGGNVGIGTNSPSSRLSISGSNSPTVPLVDLSTTGTGAWQRGVRLLNPYLGGTDSIMYSVGKADSSKNMGQFYFYYAGASSNSNRISIGLHSVDDVFNIFGSSNVAIGTTSDAGYKLRVNGNAYFDGAATFASTAYVAGNMTVNGILTAKEFHTSFVSASIIYQSGSTKFGDTTDDNHDFTGSLNITSTGTAADPVLDIINTSSATFNHSIEVMTPNMTTGENNIIVIGKESNTKNSGYIGYLYSSSASNDNVLTFGHWGSDNLMNLTGDGKVGIGLTNPGVKLDVTSDIRTATRYLINTGTANEDAAIGFWDGSNMRIEAGSAKPMLITSYQGNINLGISGGTTMNVNSSGVSVTGTVGYGNASASRGVLSYGTSGLITLEASSTNTSIAILPSGTGNVGIGTTSPGAKLDVNGSIRLSESGRLEGRAYPYTTTVGSGADATTTYVEAGSTSGYLSRISLAGGNATDGNTIKFSVASSEAMCISGSGNVGIGSTAPTAKLDVNGTIKATGINIDSRIVFDSKTMTMTNTFADALTVNMGDHTGCYVKITAFGDWSNHSSVAYLGEFFLQNGAGSYNEPGRIIRQVDNTYTDHIEAQIVDPAGSSGLRSFVIQLKATATASFTAYLQYEVRGIFDSVS